MCLPLTFPMYLNAAKAESGICRVCLQFVVNRNRPAENRSRNDGAKAGHGKCPVDRHTKQPVSVFCANGARGSMKRIPNLREARARYATDGNHWSILEKRAGDKLLDL